MTDHENGPGAARRARGRPRGWDDKAEQNTIKSLDRAMRVFEYLSEDQGKALTALASEMDESPATVYRILITLEGRGLVEFDAEQQIWHIGSQAFIIGARFLRRTSLVERARPFLRALMTSTGETANLGVRHGRAVLFVSQVETHASIRAFFPPGTLSPMHASGIGKALLAEMDDAEQKDFLTSGPFERFTEHTIFEAKALSRDLAATGERGYAIDCEERTLGMRCIAAPVFDVYGEAVAGISVSGPTSRVDPARTDALAEEVVAAARALSNAIGGSVTRPRRA